MTYYVRFLKPARMVHGRVTALITLTTDLGDSFLAADARLVAAVRIIDNSTGHTVSVLHETFLWKATDRQLQVAVGPIPNTRKSKGLQSAELAIRASHAVDEPADPLTSNARRIVSAWSPPLILEDGAQAEKLVERRFDMGDSPSLHVWEETGNSIARHIWDAAFACVSQIQSSIRGADGGPLSRLRSHAQNVSDETGDRRISVVELGSGCGIVGIALAQLLPRCSVVLTDLEEAQDIASRNARIAKPAAGSTIRFAVLDWDEELSNGLRDQEYDLIIVSDCTYNADSLPALVQTLWALTEHSPNATVFVGLKRRHESEEVFFSLMTDAGFGRHRCEEADARVAGAIETHCFSRPQSR